MAERVCPHCKNPVYDEEALLCLFCGESLGRGRRFPGKVVFAAIALLLVVSFCLSLLAR